MKTKLNTSSRGGKKYFLSPRRMMAIEFPGNKDIFKRGKNKGGEIVGSTIN